MPIVLVDVEARGPSPYSGEMSEFGAVALNEDRTAVASTFHGILIEAEPDPENPAIPLILPTAKRYSEKDVMRNFEKWLLGLGSRPVAVSDNNGYDMMWITYYFDKQGITSPFGHSSRRISDFAAGLSGNWGNTQKWKRLRVTKHDHNPVHDSLGNSEALITLFSMARGEKPTGF